MMAIKGICIGRVDQMAYMVEKGCPHMMPMVLKWVKRGPKRGSSDLERVPKMGGPELRGLNAMA